MKSAFAPRLGAFMRREAILAIFAVLFVLCAIFVPSFFTARTSSTSSSRARSSASWWPG